MIVDRSPTDITDDGWFWLRAKDVTGFPRIARDTYFPKHDVTRPAVTTRCDIPHSENETIRQLDQFALDETYLSGKWIIERPPETVDDVWDGIIEDVSEVIFWDAKVTTQFGRKEFGEESHAILVYTPNYFDREDVYRVRSQLRQAHEVTERVRYKPDIFTHKGIYEEKADDCGLSEVSRFSG